MSESPDELESLIQTHQPLISLMSTDEVYEQGIVRTLAKKLDRNLLDWSVTQGVRVYSPLAPEPATVSGTDKPERALEHLLRQKRPLIATFRGLAPFSTQVNVQRLLQDFAIQADGNTINLILMDEESLHPRVRRLAVPWRPGLPNADELRQLVRDTYQRLKKDLGGQLTSDITRAEFAQRVLNLR